MLHLTSKPKSKWMDSRKALLKNLVSGEFISEKAIFATLKIKNNETLVLILNAMQGLCLYTMLHVT